MAKRVSLAVRAVQVLDLLQTFYPNGLTGEKSGDLIQTLTAAYNRLNPDTPTTKGIIIHVVAALESDALVDTDRGAAGRYLYGVKPSKVADEKLEPEKEPAALPAAANTHTIAPELTERLNRIEDKLDRLLGELGVGPQK